MCIGRARKHVLYKTPVLLRSTALYRKLTLALIPSGLFPQRECSPKGVLFLFSFHVFGSTARNNLSLVSPLFCPSRAVSYVIPGRSWPRFDKMVEKRPTL